MENVKSSDNLRWIVHGLHPFSSSITVMSLMDVAITWSLMIRIKVFKIVELV